MARQRKYATAAERQRAYIGRLKSGISTPAQKRPARKPSRPRRLQALLTEAEALPESYTGWQEALPESLQGSEQAMKLQDTVSALERVVELLSGIEAPKGFGRD